MKYIKTYKIFESDFIRWIEKKFGTDILKEFEEVIDNIRDILLELNDIGYVTDVDFAPFSRTFGWESKSPVIKISIIRKSKTGNKITMLIKNDDEKIEFDDVILRLLSYTTGQGYKYYVDYNTYYYNIEIYKP